MQESEKQKKKIAVLNIPLLLETEAYKCDKIVAIIASPSIQKKRFLARARKNNPQIFLSEKKNLEKKFHQIKTKQISNQARKAKADFVVNTSKSKADTINQVQKIISSF